MPEYIFECESCKHIFDELQTIANIDVPLNNPCPSCKENGSIIRIVGSARIVDIGRLESTKGRLKPTSDFTDVMTRIKKNHTDSKFEVR
jgi:putative FmdB family regulatory protein